ncbi:hypothetical protein N7501_002703 [Penicillium viridicatum]|nr:hypothetical protein N7501_002703 [Penicillium viridicatum]
MTSACFLVWHLFGTLALIEGVSTRSPTTEASIRWIVDALILNAYGIAGSNIPHAQPVNVQAERSFTYGPVELRGEKVNLSARPDYGVWYGVHEAICLNVLIVEGKTDIDSGVAQALGYMGCIHRERTRFPKRDSTVYGMASNGSAFWLLKIPNDSKWSGHIVTARDNNFEHAVGLLFYLFRRAGLTSPTHLKESSAQSHNREDSTLRQYLVAFTFVLLTFPNVEPLFYVYTVAYVTAAS